MPLIDFSSLGDSKLHRLCNDLVTAEYPTARCIEGSGGDNGIDCYNGDSTDKLSTVFQHKFLPRTLGSSGKISQNQYYYYSFFYLSMNISV
jgi:hypothetical protein